MCHRVADFREVVYLDPRICLEVGGGTILNQELSFLLTNDIKTAHGD